MTNDVLNPNEIVDIEGIKIKREQVDLIKRTVFLAATDDELRLFFYECARRGVHPMDRLIYPVVRKDKENNRRVTFQTGIDYLRAAAEETARYVGQKPVEYGPDITQIIEGGEPIHVPEWAQVTVLRKDPETGEIAEVSFRAFWREYYPGEKLGHMWRKMPHGQLAKCAEAGALRKGFPRKLGGLYVNEEMAGADAVPFASERPPIQKPQEKQATVPNGQKEESLSEKPEPEGPYITPPQSNRFWAIAKASDRTDEEIHEWLKVRYGINSTSKIPKAIYDMVCTNVATK